MTSVVVKLNWVLTNGGWIPHCYKSSNFNTIQLKFHNIFPNIFFSCTVMHYFVLISVYYTEICDYTRFLHVVSFKQISFCILWFMTYWNYLRVKPSPVDHYFSCVTKDAHQMVDTIDKSLNIKEDNKKTEVISWVQSNLQGNDIITLSKHVFNTLQSLLFISFAICT